MSQVWPIWEMDEAKPRTHLCVSDLKRNKTQQSCLAGALTVAGISQTENGLSRGLVQGNFLSGLACRLISALALNLTDLLNGNQVKGESHCTCFVD